MALPKQEAFKYFESYRKELLEYARWIALKIAKENGGECNIDLVRKQLQQLPKFNNLTVDPRVMGAVFKTDMWEKIEYKPTERAIAHGRNITQWKLKPEHRFKQSDNGNLMMF